MPIQIGQKPSPTLQQPLEVLSDCHRRVESFLHGLLLVTEQAKGGKLNLRQGEALETGLRYFRDAAPKHTADEEDSLFPRMRQLGDGATRDALDKIEALESDHQRAKHGHEIVEELGHRWLADGHLSPEEAECLLDTLYELQALYEGHIAIEDNEIFPVARQVLDCEALSAVGCEMAVRRGQ